MTTPPVFDPMPRELLETIVKSELARLSVMAPTLVAVNRARRVILAAADAYRAWTPYTRPDDVAEAADHREQLAAELHIFDDYARNGGRRPSP